MRGRPQVGIVGAGPQASCWPTSCGSTALYSAKLIWDGNAYQLIKIEGLLS